MNTRPRTVLVLCPGWYPYAPALGPALLKSFLLANGYEAETVDLGPYFAQNLGPEQPPYFIDGGLLTDPLWVDALLLRMPACVDEAARRILAGKPDVVGFTVYHTTWLLSVRIAERIKQLDPRVAIVLGGPEGIRYSIDPERLSYHKEELRCVDALVPGEGELPLLGLLSGWKDGAFQPCAGAFVRIDQRFVWSGDSPQIQDLDSLPFPDFGRYDFGDYFNTKHLVTYFSRGCHKKCVYCDVEVYWKSWRNRSGLRVADEMEHLLSRHPGVKEFLFCDSIVNADIPALLSFCRIIQERQRAGRMPSVSWRGYAVAREEMTLAACQELKAAGCSWLWLGIESGSQRVLNAMKKGCRVSTAENVLRHCRLAGIETMALMMIGFPTETAEDFEETLSFLRRNAPYISELSPSDSFTYIDTGTRLKAGAFDVYGMAKDSFHSEFWQTQDGQNTYPERIRRFEAMCRCAREEGIHMAFTHEIVQAKKERQLANYDQFRSGLAQQTTSQGG